MSAFINIMALAGPIFTLQVYDRVVQHAGISTLGGLALGMCLIIVFDYILRNSRSRIMQTVALRVDAEVGRAVFEKFTSLPLNVLESRPANHWQAMFRDVDAVRNTLSGASAILICDLPFAVLFFGLIAVIATPIIWVLVIIIPIFLLITYRAGATTGKANSEEASTSRDRDSLIAEMINGRATIKALALEGSMRPMWEERHATNIERAVFRGGRTDLFTNLGQSLTTITTIAMTSFGALMIISQDLTMGALIASNMLMGRLLGPLNQLVSQWRTYSSYQQAVGRLGEMFAIESERLVSDVQMAKPKGRIECSSLTFAYAEGMPPVCDNITVSFEEGGIHALVGRNGSGKTTLLKMIQGLYRPSNGRVLLDGADIAQFTRVDLAKWMGYVPQESTLFAGTVHDNITHRFPGATDEEIIEASKAAGVHEFIIDLPDGYGADIGEAGRRLSGGQRQRIAIARALIGNPSVLLLDEPSSSLDRHAEQELRETLRELSREHTVIIVTHSPILLAACDNLVALDKGKVALAGPSKDILPRLFGGAAPVQAVQPPATEVPAPVEHSTVVKQAAVPLSQPSLPKSKAQAPVAKPTENPSNTKNSQADTKPQTPLARPALAKTTPNPAKEPKAPALPSAVPAPPVPLATPATTPTPAPNQVSGPAIKAPPAKPRSVAPVAPDAPAATPATPKGASTATPAEKPVPKSGIKPLGKSAKPKSVPKPKPDAASAVTKPTASETNVTGKDVGTEKTVAKESGAGAIGSITPVKKEVPVDRQTDFEKPSSPAAQPSEKPPVTQPVGQSVEPDKKSRLHHQRKGDDDPYADAIISLTRERENPTP